MDTSATLSPQYDERDKNYRFACEILWIEILGFCVDLHFACEILWIEILGFLRDCRIAGGFESLKEGDSTFCKQKVAKTF